MSHDRIPLGKYKGWPIEELANDPKYVRWLTRQPWFRFAVAVSRQPWFDRVAGKAAEANQRREGD